MEKEIEKLFVDKFIKKECRERRFYELKLRIPTSTTEIITGFSSKRRQKRLIKATTARET